MPTEEFLYYGHPATVDRLGVELREPRAQAVGNSIHNPQTDFIAILHRILPAVLVFKPYAEDAGDCFPS
jgi:hypothetical protein